MTSIYEEYYESLGYSKSDIETVMSKINCKKKLHCRNRAYLKEIYGDRWFDIYQQSAEKYRHLMESNGTWIPLDMLNECAKYRRLVKFYTEQSVFMYGLNNIDKRGIDYHLDHKYSIKNGFINNIPPEIVGSIVNLEILPASLNLEKKSRNSITQETLYRSYKEFKNESKINSQVN